MILLQPTTPPPPPPPPPPTRPWTIVKSDCKKRARINCMKHFLSSLPYPNKDRMVVHHPDRLIVGAGSHVIGADDHILGKTLHPDFPQAPKLRAEAAGRALKWSPTSGGGCDAGGVQEPMGGACPIHFSSLEYGLSLIYMERRRNDAVCRQKAGSHEEGGEARMETEFTPWMSLAGGVLIGISATLLMAMNGRIAGMTGILTGIIPADFDRLGLAHRFFSPGLRSLRRCCFLALLDGAIPYAVPGLPAAACAGRTDRRYRRFINGGRLHLRPWRLRHGAAVAADRFAATVTFMIFKPD